ERVVWLAGAARADRGGAVLHPAGVPLREVLQGLRDGRAGHTLLLIDLAPAPPDPRAGRLSDDVATAVADDLRAVPDDRWLAVVPCSPNEVPHTSPELGRSVFAHYAEEGLRGWADGWGEAGRRDYRITSRELAEFVRARVERWSRRNRTARQTPFAVG